jgi:hypothetical protein
MDWTQIIVTAITIGVPAAVTLMTGKKLKKQANKHSARQSIMQLILEDKVRVMEGGLPENYQAILDEFDEYRDNGGNSYISQKVDDYIGWYENLKKPKKGGRNAKK